MRRRAPTALAAVTYLVEHAQPSSGEAAPLPKAPALC